MVGYVKSSLRDQCTACVHGDFTYLHLSQVNVRLVCHKYLQTSEDQPVYQEFRSSLKAYLLTDQLTSEQFTWEERVGQRDVLESFRF